MNSLEQYFFQARENNRAAQKALYEMFSGKMLAVAKSYTGNLHDAEDVLMNAFYKCFTKINDCKDWKSFPFWLRKIVVNDSISFVRKNRNLLYSDYEIEKVHIEDEPEIDVPNINLDEIFPQMPEGYKIVFNLYVFEEKKHSEIAEILNISEGTSKSQLNKAKKWLAEFLKKNENVLKQSE